MLLAACGSSVAQVQQKLEDIDRTYAVSATVRVQASPTLVDTTVMEWRLHLNGDFVRVTRGDDVVTVPLDGRRHVSDLKNRFLRDCMASFANRRVAVQCQLDQKEDMSERRLKGPLPDTTEVCHVVASQTFWLEFDPDGDCTAAGWDMQTHYGCGSYRNPQTFETVSSVCD